MYASADNLPCFAIPKLKSFCMQLQCPTPYIMRVLSACDKLNEYDSGDFVCGRCMSARASQQVAVDCGATLIVCPASILQQWQSEIANHTQPGALRVITYLGQNKTSLDTVIAKAGEASPLTGDGSQRADAEPVRKGRKGKHSGQGVLSAEDLAAADVVLTTYDVLKRDVHHQADPDQQGKTFRTRKRYEVHWCRCCFAYHEKLLDTALHSCCYEALKKVLHFD